MSLLDYAEVYDVKYSGGYCDFKISSDESEGIGKHSVFKIGSIESFHYHEEDGYVCFSFGIRDEEYGFKVKANLFDRIYNILFGDF